MMMMTMTTMIKEENYDDGKCNCDENSKVYLMPEEGAVLPCVGESWKNYEVHHQMMKTHDNDEKDNTKSFSLKHNKKVQLWHVLVKVALMMMSQLSSIPLLGEAPLLLKQAAGKMLRQDFFVLLKQLGL